jgi:hypothetical protein
MLIDIISSSVLSVPISMPWKIGSRSSCCTVIEGAPLTLATRDSFSARSISGRISSKALAPGPVMTTWAGAATVISRLSPKPIARPARLKACKALRRPVCAR